MARAPTTFTSSCTTRKRIPSEQAQPSPPRPGNSMCLLPPLAAWGGSRHIEFPGRGGEGCACSEGIRLRVVQEDVNVVGARAIDGGAGDGAHHGFHVVGGKQFQRDST